MGSNESRNFGDPCNDPVRDGHPYAPYKYWVKGEYSKTPHVLKKGDVMKLGSSQFGNHYSLWSNGKNITTSSMADKEGFVQVFFLDDQEELIYVLKILFGDK